MKRIIGFFLSLGLLPLLWLGGEKAIADNINPDQHFAWAENIGWINFKPAQGEGVTVTDTSLTGFAWSENAGWINLDPASSGVINAYGQLSGHAWGENVGWINFAPLGGGVTIDGLTGDFAGLAWGENVGWINFAPVYGGINTFWRVDSDGDGIVDVDDTCPFEDATGLDADLDGCIDTLEGIALLVEDLVALGEIDPLMQMSLAKKIANAQKAADKGNFCDAIDKLVEFQGEINAQSGKKIAEAAAVLLTEYADNLITQLLAELSDGSSC